MRYHHSPFTADQITRSKDIVAAAEALDEIITANTKPGPQQTLALRHLEDTVMRVNKAIAEEPPAPVSTLRKLEEQLTAPLATPYYATVPCPVSFILNPCPCTRVHPDLDANGHIQPKTSGKKLDTAFAPKGNTTAPRLRRLRVAQEFLFSLLTSGQHVSVYEVVGDAVPKDARVVQVNIETIHTSKTPSIELLLESADFPPVPEGELIPFLYPMFRVDKVIQQWAE